MVVAYVLFKSEVKVMKRLAACTAALLLAFLIVSCEDDSPTTAIETITFEVTARDDDVENYDVGDIVCDPSLGKAGEDPVSIEFKPEIRIYPPNSTTYHVVDLPTNGAMDPEYFGVTPCKNIDNDLVEPCIPCCEDPLDTSCTDCIGYVKPPEGMVPQIIPINGNYRFTVRASGGKVVGIFKKKDYRQEAQDVRDDAAMQVQVCLNGQVVNTFTAVTKEVGGGIYITIPID